MTIFREYISYLLAKEERYKEENEWYIENLKCCINDTILKKYGDYKLIRPFSNNFIKKFSFYNNTYCLIEKGNIVVKVENIGCDEPSILNFKIISI